LAENNVMITGKSDSYDETLKKIIELNKKMNEELKASKKYLESTNEIYKELSRQTKDFATSLGQIFGITTQSSKSTEQAINRVQRGVDKLKGKADRDGLSAIQSSVKSIAGMLKGNSNFASILTNSLKTAVSSSSSLNTSLATTSSTIGATSSAAGGASAGLASMGGAALGTAGAVLAVVAAIAALLGMMYKLGEGGYKAQLTIANSEKVLGSSFKTAYGWANKMNDELGIAQDRTMALISATAQLGRSSGMSTQSSATMGIGANRLAVQISNSTGIDIESITGQINSALGGSNSLGAYGINVSDTAAKYWLLQKKGIDAFNGAVSESTMVYARYMLIQEQANVLKYKDSENTQNLAAMQLKLKNTMDSLSKYAQAIFIPVFQAITEVLLALAEATLWVVNGFREILGMKQLTLDIGGPSQESIDAAGDLYSQYKKMGDELEALKQQLYGFDEVITQNPYDNTIADLSLEDAGLTDVIDTDGAVKDGKQYAQEFRESFKTVLSKMGPLGETMGMFFNVDNKAYEEMNELEQWLNQPGKKFIELAEKGEADTWTFAKAVLGESLHEFPIVAEIEALLKGDGKDFILECLQTGLLFNPITWPIGLLWKGFDILSKFKDENGEWDVLVEFLGLGKLKEGFEEACDWLYEKLSGFGGWLGEQIKSALSNLNPANAAVNLYSYAKGLNQDQENSLRERLSTTWIGGLLPGYEKGGFIKAAHIAQLDPNEVALPLTPSVLSGIGDRIFENSRVEGSGGGNITVNVHLGENGAIIADNYSLQKFSKKIGENVAQQLKSTGQLAYGRKY